MFCLLRAVLRFSVLELGIFYCWNIFSPWVLRLREEDCKAAELCFPQAGVLFLRMIFVSEKAHTYKVKKQIKSNIRLFLYQVYLTYVAQTQGLFSVVSNELHLPRRN